MLDVASEPCPDWPHRLARALGEELRAQRTVRGWSPEELASRMDSELTAGILRAYEAGIRPITVERLVAVARALGAPAAQLVQRACQRVWGDPDAVGWPVDLVAACGLTDPALAPLRRWAVVALREVTDPASTVARLSGAGLRVLAHLCDLPVVDLAHRLPHP